jgi:hypothetical protein
MGSPAKTVLKDRACLANLAGLDQRDDQRVFYDLALSIATTDSR